MIGEYKVGEWNMGWLEKRIGRLNKRAEKLQVAPIGMTITGQEFETDVKIDPIYHTRTETITKFYLIRITGETPKLAGWNFIATLQHEEAGNVLRRVPGHEETEIPEQYRTSTRNCDHCQKDIRRNDTYILVNDDGTWKQVGRNCLRDFLGHQDPHRIAEWAELICELDRILREPREDNGPRPIEYFDTLGFLEEVAAMIRTNGWVSGGYARKYSTEGRPITSTVSETLNVFHNRLYKGDKPAIEEQDKEMAAGALAYGRALEVTTDDDYLWNLRIACSDDHILYRSAGLVGSLIPAYQRHLGREVERQKRFESEKNSQWVGEVGRRDIFTLTLVGCRQFESDYGVTTMLKFRDPAGNVVVWWASGCKNWSDDLGKSLQIRATVKAHNGYNGIKQTTISRAVVVGETTSEPVEA
jgi:hypothetical protein